MAVEWKPYIIDPGTNVDGETVESYCKRRWGGSGWTKSLKVEGRKDGANFANWKMWPHTLKAHQLIQFCKQNNLASSDKVNELLFQAEYEKGLNISKVEILVDIAKDNLGLSPSSLADLSEFLTGNHGAHQVKSEIMAGHRKYGISGVPFFIVEGTSSPNQRPYGFSGAQSSETFLEIFEELADE